MAVLLEYVLKLAIFTTSFAILIQFLISYLDYLFKLHLPFSVYPCQILEYFWVKVWTPLLKTMKSSHSCVKSVFTGARCPMWSYPVAFPTSSLLLSSLVCLQPQCPLWSFSNTPGMLCPSLCIDFASFPAAFLRGSANHLKGWFSKAWRGTWENVFLLSSNKMLMLPTWGALWELP